MKVGVIMGGVSSERDVSLMTGREIISNLDRSQYEIIPIEISDQRDIIRLADGIDIALLALHGRYGEDGIVQGTLETMGIPYTGSSVLSSSLCMDKELTKRLLRYEGVSTPDWCLLKSSNDLDQCQIPDMGYPVVVKPNAGGSSIGVTLAKDEESLMAAIREAFRWGEEVLVEQYISGQEITCSILNDEYLPVLSIRPNAEFFDYTSKYKEGESEEITARLDAKTAEEVRQAAEISYRAMKCSVYARIDMIVKEGIPYVMEVNTLPGMTSGSLLPKSALAAGISFSGLLDRIIAGSLLQRKNEY